MLVCRCMVERTTNVVWWSSTRCGEVRDVRCLETVLAAAAEALRVSCFYLFCWKILNFWACNFGLRFEDFYWACLGLIFYFLFIYLGVMGRAILAHYNHICVINL
ncbi:hypothetical protein V6Z11_A01G217700 [Gossypium hirsutum]|uniref:Transmembrane protein n=2 Tax=Gossypium darwinii TaxID=34276 RepID=A0A5D2HPG6_GOSDA|nr:hypothetical protein ES288_A01G223800v1 [Gossypium darwinii]